MGAILKNGVVYGGSMDQVQSNYTESDSTSPAYIRNKPTLGSASAKDSTTSITEGGTDLPTSGAVYTALQNVHIDVDTEIDNTSNNPIANSAVANALDGKVDAESGKGLSANDFTTAYKDKLDGIGAGAEANVQSDWSESSSASDAFILNKPTTLSAFTNDSGFINNTVNNLTNYYTKTESYSKTEVDSMISAAKSGRFIYVATLPTTDIHTDAIYLVPKTVSQTDNVKDEYINLDGTTTGWEKIGDTEIDLSDYYTKEDVDDLLEDKADLTSVSAIGKCSTTDGNLTLTTNIDFHRDLMVGDRILVHFDNDIYTVRENDHEIKPEYLVTYNNGTAVTTKIDQPSPYVVYYGYRTLIFKNGYSLFELKESESVKYWDLVSNSDLLPDHFIGSSSTASGANTLVTNVDLHRKPIVGDRIAVYFENDIYCYYHDSRYAEPGNITILNNNNSITISLTPGFIMETMEDHLVYSRGMHLFEYTNSGSVYYFNHIKTLSKDYTLGTGLSYLSSTNTLYNTKPQNGKNIAEIIITDEVTNGYLGDFSDYNNCNYAILTFNEDATIGASSSYTYQIMQTYSGRVTRTICKPDGTPFTDDISAGTTFFIYLPSIGTISSIVEFYDGAVAAPINKTRYTITATNWSNSVDANDYYTYTITLNPELSLSWPPSTDIAGANNNTFSTDAEKEAYDLLDECNLTDTDTLVLYAKTKPTVNFYIWVEGEVAS